MSLFMYGLSIVIATGIAAIISAHKGPYDITYVCGVYAGVALLHLLNSRYRSQGGYHEEKEG